MIIVSEFVFWAGRREFIEELSNFVSYPSSLPYDRANSVKILVLRFYYLLFRLFYHAIIYFAEIQD